MKKLIAILAVFAVVAGTALFAQDQGSWSLGGNARIGTGFNFTPYELRDTELENSEQSVVLTGGTPYEDYHGTGDLRGSLGLNYRRGGLTTGLSFNTGGTIEGNLEYYGDSYAFRAHSNLISLFNGYGANSVKNLWGWYNFGGFVRLETALKHDGWQDNIWRVSDVFGTTPSHAGTQSNGGNYLRFDVTPMSGLELGFILPNIFSIGGSFDVNSMYNEAGGLVYDSGQPATRLRLLEQAIEFFKFGVKFQTGPVALAAQYGLDGRPEVLTNADAVFLGSSAYLSGSFQISDAMKAELDFRGKFFKSFDAKDVTYPDGTVAPEILPDRSNANSALENVTRNELKIGGKFSFDSGPLSLSLKIKYENDIATGMETGVVKFGPYVRYNIGNNLQIGMDSEVGIPLSDYVLAPGSFTGYNADIKNTEDEEALKKGSGTIWAPALTYFVEPFLRFNFSGAGWDNTGIGVKYTLSGDMYSGDLINKHANNPGTSLLRVVFHWNF